MNQTSSLSGPGRRHDLLVAVEAVTPGEFKSRGAGIRIEYGFHPTRFGSCLLGLTQRGICWLSFVSNTGERAALQELKSHWGGAAFVERPEATGPVASRIFSSLEGRQQSPLSLLLMGTNFQIKVWRALLEISAGAVVSYGALGVRIGASRAARAIGSAVGQNAVAYLIPCHRVIRKSGAPGGYRWGDERKRAMLAWEAARTQPARAGG